MFFDKCPFCGKNNVVVNSFTEKYHTRFEYFCIDCCYVWYKQDMKSHGVDPTELGYGLACQVED